jgi:hypothetical protein
VWIARALAQLILTATVAFAIAVVVAGLLALARGGEFLASLRITALCIGALLLLMGASGGTLARAADADARQGALGHLPGVPSWAESRPDETTLSSSAVFVISGLALLLLGLVVG